MVKYSDLSSLPSKAKYSSCDLIKMNIFQVLHLLKVLSKSYISLVPQPHPWHTKNSACDPIKLSLDRKWDDEIQWKEQAL